VIRGTSTSTVLCTSTGMSPDEFRCSRGGSQNSKTFYRQDLSQVPLALRSVHVPTARLRTSGFWLAVGIITNEWMGAVFGSYRY
jgi:hypothetical protein